MKKLLPIGSLVGCSLLAMIPGAFAQTSGFYATGDLGGTLTRNADLKEFFGPVAPDSRVKFEPGVRLGVAGGYHITDWLGIEGVSGIMSSKLDSVTDATHVHDSYLSNVPLMAGVRLEWPHPFMHLTPYAGASAGGAVSIMDADHLNINGVSVRGAESDVVFAYQAFGGVRYAINEHMGVGVEYHFFSEEDPEWRSDHVSGVPSNRFSIGGVTVNSLSVAFQYKF